MDIKDLIQKADAYGKEQQKVDENFFTDALNAVANALGISTSDAEEIVNKDKAEEVEQQTTGNVPDESDPNQDAGGNALSQGQAGAAAAQKDLMTRYNEGGKQAMPEIEKLQQDLKDLGFDPNGVDGKYGNGTYNAVKAFQEANGLQVDGQAGPATLAKIEEVKAGGGGASGTAMAAGQAGATGATAPGDQGDGTRGGSTIPPETQATIDELNQLLQQLGEPIAPPASGGDPEVVSASADQDSISFMRGAIKLAESLLREATEEQKAKLGELLAKLGDTQWAQDNADAYQQYVDRTNRAMNAGNQPTTPNATTAAAAGRADAADAGGATDAERAAGAGATQTTPNATTAAAAGRADAADAGGATDAERAAGAGQRGPDDGNRAGNTTAPQTTAQNDADSADNATPAPPKVSKEVYIQMAPDRPASQTNFNVAKMKAKYPKPYVEIPNTDGTVTRGYGPEANLNDYVANKGKKLNAKIVKPGGASQNRVSGGTPAPTNTQPSSTQNQQRGTLAASKEYDMKNNLKEGASMNISAENASEIAELLGILKNAGMPNAAPVADMHVPEPQGPMPCATCGGDHDADSPCGGGEEWDNSPDEGYGDMMDIIKLSGGPNSNKNPGDIRVKDPRQNDEEVEEDGWDNSPDEEYKDDDYMYQSGGIHKKKKSHPPVAGGDNPMALENSIKAQLYKALEEKLQNK